MPEPFQIRGATPGDLQSITEFLEPFVDQQQILPRSRGELETLLRHGFIAEVDSKPVGFAAVEIYSKKLAEVQCLCVAEEYRRAGLGSRLVRMCVDRAAKENVCELMAITAVESLFTDCGFDYSLPGQKRALFVQTQKR